MTENTAAHDCTTKCSYPGPNCPGHAAPQIPTTGVNSHGVVTV